MVHWVGGLWGQPGFEPGGEPPVAVMQELRV